ncbi:MAG: ABC transporter substrate-binding protein [Acidobacteriaceae bacterium]|nr:ABC transporter substrate-binding protein [Acidobacteriaceae bacterium]
MMRAVTALACAALLSCGRNGHIVVGSKNFTEQLILGEIAAQQMERKLHVAVDRKLNLGGTLLAHEALVAGQIDLYPEYTGTAVTNVLKLSPLNDPAKSYMQVKDAYFDRFRLVWLPPLGFNDTFAMVVRAKDGRSLSPPALSAAAGAREWRLGVGYEFLTRPDGLRALDRAYGFRWQGTAKSMDLGLLYQALRENQVDMAAGNSTDGALTGQSFMVLSDDKKAFPAYDACLVVRESLLRNRPDVRAALTMLSGRINEETVRNMNREVEVQHRSVPEVAKEFLAAQP